MTAPATTTAFTSNPSTWMRWQVTLTSYDGEGDAIVHAAVTRAAQVVQADCKLQLRANAANSQLTARFKSKQNAESAQASFRALKVFLQASFHVGDSVTDIGPSPTPGSQKKTKSSGGKFKWQLNVHPIGQSAADTLRSWLLQEFPTTAELVYRGAEQKAILKFVHESDAVKVKGLLLPQAYPVQGPERIVQRKRPQPQPQPIAPPPFSQQQDKWGIRLRNALSYDEVKWQALDSVLKLIAPSSRVRRPTAEMKFGFVNVPGEELATKVHQQLIALGFDDADLPKQKPLRSPSSSSHHSSSKSEKSKSKSTTSEEKMQQRQQPLSVADPAPAPASAPAAAQVAFAGPMDLTQLLRLVPTAAPVSNPLAALLQARA